MRFRRNIRSSLAVSAFLIAGTWTLTQATAGAGSPRDAGRGQSHGPQAQSGQAAGIAVDHAGGNGVRRMDGYHAGNGGSSGAPTNAKSMGSAHETESLDAHKSSGNSHATQDTKSGENPLYESKDKANLKPNAGASNVQLNKNGRDMKARYRPGNKKWTANRIAVDHAGGNGVRR